MKLFITNQNRSERIVRFIVSLFLLPTPFVLECTTYSMILGILGGILLFNSIVGTCYIYRVLGISTCIIKEYQKNG